MKQKKESTVIRQQLAKLSFGIEGLQLVRIAILGTLIFMVVATCLFRPIQIQGESMYPTLTNREVGVTNIIGRYVTKIKRFDIVTVYNEAEGKTLAKRVIGLPGETIQYRDDNLYINGQIVAETFLDSSYVATQTNDKDIQFTSDYGPITLKDDEYFLCGDNRRVSKDSRLLGPFKADAILSDGIFIIF